MSISQFTKSEKKHQYTNLIPFRGPCEHRHNLRFLFLGTNYMYICSRCFGLYGGFLLFSLMIVLFQSIIYLIQTLNLLYIISSSFILTLPLVFDWLSQSKGLRHSTNFIRFVTGLLTSLSSVIIIVAYKSLWLTFPLGFLWFFIVQKVGRYWRHHRSTLFGCSACRSELQEAIAISGEVK